MSSVTPSRIARDPTARWRRCIDGVVVMAGDADEPMFLSAPGDAIWRLLEEPRTVDELIDELATEFAGDRASIADDVAAFVVDLRRAGLIRR
jgi:hypothetical protein